MVNDRSRSRRMRSNSMVVGIYGGILRFARGAENLSVMRKSSECFSEKITFKQRDEIAIRFNLMES
jgi:hypothetical protein